MYNEITILVLIIIILILMVSLFINSKNQATPWTRIALSSLRRLLYLKPNIIKSWEHCTVYEYFKNDSKLVIVADNPRGIEKIRPGASVFAGSTTEYDIFTIIRARTIADNVYILDVEYLGSGSNKSGFKLEYTL